jgi:hypothetical protein
VRSIDSPEETVGDSWREDMLLILSVRERVEQLERACQLYKAIADNPTANGEDLASKILTSPHRGSLQLPPNFDPVWYLARHKDLFDVKADPYQHYLEYGCSERQL